MRARYRQINALLSYIMLQPRAPFFFSSAAIMTRRYRDNEEALTGECKTILPDRRPRELLARASRKSLFRNNDFAPGAGGTADIVDEEVRRHGACRRRIVCVVENDRRRFAARLSMVTFSFRGGNCRLSSLLPLRRLPPTMFALTALG